MITTPISLQDLRKRIYVKAKAEPTGRFWGLYVHVCKMETLRVEINEEKSRMVDLKKGESFTFLGFEFRRVLSCNKKWRPNFAPKLKKRTELFGKLKEIFRHSVSQPVGKVIEQINPILRGWVNYFRVGHSSRCFSRIEDWVEKKVRRHLMRARNRKGYGWKRWRKALLYGPWFV